MERKSDDIGSKSQLSIDSTAQSGNRTPLQDPEKLAVEQSTQANSQIVEEGTPDHSKNPWHPSQFPDGGLEAWGVVAGAACGMFCSFGWLNAIGVFQSYYATHQLKDYTSSEVAWIPSLEIFMMFIMGPLVGYVYDNRGPRELLLVGSFLHVFGLMMTSISHTYYQILLAQGICSPLGLNCIFNASIGSVTTWFFKKRGAAFGIMAAGSSLGGVIFPIMVNHLIEEVGFGWSMRIVAFMILGMLIIANLTIKSRLPPKKRAFKWMQFVTPFKDLKFSVLTVACFLFFMGLFIPINFIETQALASGMSLGLAQYLIPILNAASVFGRVIPGILADKWGRYNLNIITSFLSGIFTLALWLPASGNAAVIAFAALYGFTSGAFVSLAPGQIAQISKVEDIGVRSGLLFAVLSFAGLVASPIAGAIVNSQNGSFTGAQIYAGVFILAGATMFIFARATLVGFKLAVKV
ncbi:MFS general substrate transporter [Lophium mytilinum]|uniref:MFS general substrate transporter n=1 Tax=Lophium mytilinum TaxID=390894 RepID=A0A6A6R981_9PEZI|nr:MFS general substrate transporter [Lophium mytilinum]